MASVLLFSRTDRKWALLMLPLVSLAFSYSSQTNTIIVIYFTVYMKIPSLVFNNIKVVVHTGLRSRRHVEFLKAPFFLLFLFYWNFIQRFRSEYYELTRPHSVTFTIMTHHNHSIRLVHIASLSSCILVLISVRLPVGPAANMWRSALSVCARLHYSSRLTSCSGN